MAKYGGSVLPAQEAVTLNDAIDAILLRDGYKEISDGFGAYASRQSRPPPWYFDPNAASPKQLASIWKLANEVDAAGEYKSIYRHASYFTHGGYSGTHLKSDVKGVAVGAMRTPEGARQALLLSFSLLSHCIRRVIEQWRAAEMPDFVRTYVEEWRHVIADMPDVEVAIERTVNPS